MDNEIKALRREVFQLKSSVIQLQYLLTANNLLRLDEDFKGSLSCPACGNVPFDGFVCCNDGCPCGYDTAS